LLYPFWVLEKLSILKPVFFRKNQFYFLKIALDLEDFINFIEHFFEAKPSFAQRKLPELNFWKVKNILNNLQKHLTRRIRNSQELS